MKSSTTFFRGLRERRLFNLAEAYCLHRLSRAELPPDQRGRFELSNSPKHNRNMRSCRKAEGAESGTRRGTELEDLLARDPQNPRRILLEAGTAITFPSPKGSGLAGRRIDAL